MKKARMNISHFRFILFNLEIFGEIVTTFRNCKKYVSNKEQNDIAHKPNLLPCNTDAQTLYTTLIKE